MEFNYNNKGALSASFITIKKGCPKVLNISFAITTRDKVVERFSINLSEVIKDSRGNIKLTGNNHVLKSLETFARKVNGYKIKYGLSNKDILLWDTKTKELWNAVIALVMRGNWSTGSYKKYQIPSIIKNFMATFKVISIYLHIKLSPVFEVAKRLKKTKAKYSSPIIEVGLIPVIFPLILAWHCNRPTYDVPKLYGKAV